MQDDNDNESFEDSSDEDGDITMLTRNFNKFLRKKNSSRIRNFNKKYKEDGKKKTKEVTYYQCKKPGHIRSECPKLKSKNKGAKDRKKTFEATWDDTSESEREEEQDEVFNLCFMALEDDNEVPFTSYSSLDDDCDNNDDDNDDDERSIVSKLMLKCKRLFAKKKHYKHELTSLIKEFKILKIEFSNLVKSNDKFVNDLKNSSSLEEQLKKANDENLNLSNEMLELRNSISKF